MPGARSGAGPDGRIADHQPRVRRRWRHVGEQHGFEHGHLVDHHDVDKYQRLLDDGHDFVEQQHHCNPADACGQNSGSCGVNTVGGGNAPESAAVATYNCACTP